MEQPQANGRASRKANSKPPAPIPSQMNLSELLQALQSVRDGDFSVRLPSDQTGLAGKVADTFNDIVTANQRLAWELERVGQIVGKDGKTRHRMSSERRSGAWGAMEHSVNTLIDDLLWPTTEVTRTISAVACVLWAVAFMVGPNWPLLWVAAVRLVLSLVTGGVLRRIGYGQS